MEATDDWAQFVIDPPMAHEPGCVFAYCSEASEPLAYIFQKETGQDIARTKCGCRQRPEIRYKWRTLTVSAVVPIY